MAERLGDSGILRTRARPRAASKSDSEWMISERQYNLLLSTEVSRDLISSQKNSRKRGECHFIYAMAHSSLRPG